MCVVELRDCVVNVHARDFCDAYWQNVSSDACVFLIVVIDTKWVFLCNNEKVDNFVFMVPCIVTP